MWKVTLALIIVSFLIQYAEKYTCSVDECGHNESFTIFSSGYDNVVDWHTVSLLQNC